MLKKLIIKLLFRLLEEPNYGGARSDKVAQWLDTTYTDLRFKDYYKKRTLAILRTMGLGATRDDYLIMVGQRLELAILLNDGNKAYTAAEKKRAKLKKSK